MLENAAAVPLRSDVLVAAHPGADTANAPAPIARLHEALDALHAHSSELAYAAEDALADKPHLREKLGLLERS